MRMRKATEADISDILDCFAHGRAIQEKTGNKGQWAEGYPTEEMVKEDILLERSYVAVSDIDDSNIDSGIVLATIVGQKEPDVHYEDIDGEWLNDSPYISIHRIATNGKVKGAGRFLFDQLVDKFDNLRIDTKKANKPMLKLIQSYNFTYCGIIKVHDGTERLAFQLSK